MIGWTGSVIRAASAVEPNRELTTREQNLFGEKYPPETLKALGLTKPKGKGKGAASASGAAATRCRSSSCSDPTHCASGSASS